MVALPHFSFASKGLFFYEASYKGQKASPTLAVLTPVPRGAWLDQRCESTGGYYPGENEPGPPLGTTCSASKGPTCRHCSFSCWAVILVVVNWFYGLSLALSINRCLNVQH